MQTTPSRDALMQNEAELLFPHLPPFVLFPFTVCGSGATRLLKVCILPTLFLLFVAFIFWATSAARRISISISAWLSFYAFAYAINLARAATAKGYQSKVMLSKRVTTVIPLPPLKACWHGLIRRNFLEELSARSKPFASMLTHTLPPTHTQKFSLTHTHTCKLIS